MKDGFAGCTPAVRHCRGRRPRRPAGQAALCWLCVGRPAHRPPRTSAIAGKFAVRRPTYKPQKGWQRFPVGADSISARGGSRRRALSSGRGPGMPGPYRVAIVPGGMTFLRTSAIAGKFAVRRPTYKPQKGWQRFPVGADSISARGGSRRRALSVRPRAGHARPLQGCNSPREG